MLTKKTLIFQKLNVYFKVFKNQNSTINFFNFIFFMIKNC